MERECENVHYYLLLMMVTIMMYDLLLTGSVGQIQAAIIRDSNYIYINKKK